MLKERDDLLVCFFFVFPELKEEEKAAPVIAIKSTAVNNNLKLILCRQVNIMKPNLRKIMLKLKSAQKY
jgi:hypothetical protein